MIFWALNWSLTGIRTHLAFFPMWLGYCLTVDALVFWRKGTSLLTRSPRTYVSMFIISAPSWWLFEILNWRTQNWYYDGRHYFSDLEYVVLASLSFSTVMPSVFGTAELVSTFKWMHRFISGPRVAPNKAALIVVSIAGWLALSLLLIWPIYFFPMLWLSIYFILEPINIWLGNRSLARYTAEGNWRPVLALCIGCLICGLFWETWNFFSYPKWIYRIPFADFMHIFEMPLLGYGGYLPFALELYALYHFVVGVGGVNKANDYIQID